MEAEIALTELMSAIEARRWESLATFLHPEFSCRYVHTGEQFDAAAWIRLTADYPGFDHLRVEETVGTADVAACRSHVTGFDERGTLMHFECATFVRMRSGLIHRMTEVWTDVAQQPPEGTRPGMP